MVLAQAYVGRLCVFSGNLGDSQISFKRRHRYATLAYDLDRARVVWVGESKGRETIDRFFAEALSDGQKSRISWAGSDMSVAYSEAIKAHCPNATPVIDRFRLVTALNEAADAVHKQQWREFVAAQRKSVKGLRWLRGMRLVTRTKPHRRQLNRPAHGIRSIYRASVLKDKFKHFWSYSYLGSTAPVLKRRRASALRSRPPFMRVFEKTLRAHYDDIITCIGRPPTDAIAEGSSRTAKVAKSRASGFRGLYNLADMLYLIVWGPDTADRIPAAFKAL